MDNGTLLAPDRPMTYVDAVLVAHAFGDGDGDGDDNGGGNLSPAASSVTLTGSDGHSDTWHYVLYVGKGEGNLTTTTLGLTPDPKRSFAAVDTLGGGLVTFDDTHPIPVHTTNPPGEDQALQLWQIAPVGEGGVALIGERSKWVSVSRARFSSYNNGHDASVTVSGGKGEEVEVSWAVKGDIVTTKCSFVKDGVMVARMSASGNGQCS